MTPINSVREVSRRSAVGEPGYLILQSLVKQFGNKKTPIVQAVNGVSIEISRGEFVTFLGPSGCGKTTTLRMIAGFEVPTSGRIILGGRDITATPPFRRDIPMVFQDYALFPHLSVFENIAYGLRARKVDRESIRHDVAVACQMVNLIGMENRYPGQLSGGQKQRVALARALVLKPEIILFDEPLSNLDAKLRIQTRAEIKRVQQLLGITIVYVTHDQAEALSLSDRIVIMNRGEVVQTGTPEQIYNEPVSPFVSDFIGNSNFLDGEVVQVLPEAVTVSVGSVDLTVQRTQCEPDLNEGDPVVVALRPEAISVLDQPGDLSGRIDFTGFVGAITEYKILFGDGIITALQPNTPGGTRIFGAGELVGLRFETDALRVYRSS